MRRVVPLPPLQLCVRTCIPYGTVLALERVLSETRLLWSAFFVFAVSLIELEPVTRSYVKEYCTLRWVTRGLAGPKFTPNPKTLVAQNQGSGADR